MNDFSTRYLAARSDESRRACLNAELKRLAEETGYRPGVSWSDGMGVYMPADWSEHLSRNLATLISLQQALQAYSDYDGPIFLRTPGDDPEEPLFVLRRDTPSDLMRKAEYITEAVQRWAIQQSS